MSVYRLQSEMTALEIGEWMAYYLTEDKEWKAKILKEKELEESRKLSGSQKAAKLKGILRGK